MEFYMGVVTIIREHLGRFKVSARWVFRNLSIHDRHQRVFSSRGLLQLYEVNPANPLSSLVTGDEAWIIHWDPESKLASMQWKHRTSPTPMKFRMQPSAGKILA